MWGTTPLALALIITVVRGFTDPCDPDGHRELDDKRRSTGYLNEYPETPLCDVTLKPDWYRFTSGAGGMMPETCPKILQCGTVVPVWLRGKHPTMAEGTVSRIACANFHTGAAVTHPCCEHWLEIGVKNCGHFYVYFLKPTPSCPISYCAGDKPPCPHGFWSVTGFPPCKEAYPKVNTDPVLTGPEVVGNTFNFACHVNYSAHDPDLAFDVQWLFDGKPDPSMPMETIRDPARVAHLDGARLKGHMGTNVGCQIRARYMTHVNMSSPWLKSNTYWAGIRMDPTHVTISEKEETQSVTLASTIPILCNHNSVCCLTMKLDVDGPKENLVVAHECEYEICSDDWDPATNEASIRVPLTASKDQITDGDKDLMMAFENILSSGGGPYLQAFDHYKPQNVPVDVKDTQTKSCTWTGDPHIHGMNYRGTFHLFKVGDYTMFENPSRHAEVQARTWPCNRGRATCICGVTIREKNDVIRISECDQPYAGHHTSPTVQVASGLREGTVVHRSTDGKHITVYFPSGLEIKLDAGNWGMNAYLTIPSIDAGGARGICGTFDGIPGNEFTRRDGSKERECTNCVPERFTQSWNNDHQHSLFETLPPKLNESYVPKYCTCDKDAAGASRINCTAAGDVPRHLLKCEACHPIQGSLPSFLDPTKGWSRRRSVFYEDVDEADPKFDVAQYKNFQVSQPSWPTPSGITEEQAKGKCRHALESSQLWSHCVHLPNIADINIIDCVTDILYGDNFDMVELAQLAFLTECQTTLSRDPANYVTDASGKSVVKPEISSDVCSVFCLRHGTCVRGKCVCHSGYAGENCHLTAGKGPQLARIRSNNTCDMNTRPCRKIYMDATNIENNEHLSCKVKLIQDDGSLSTESFIKTAEFLSAGRLACFLPDTNGMAVTSFSVSATNEGNHYGNSLNVTVYDSTCQSCDQHGNCTQLASTCLINNKCHQNGDVNPDNETQICDVNASTSDWTTPTELFGNFPNIGTPVLIGPDDDFMMTCALNTSATEDSARFRVTWYVNNNPKTAITAAAMNHTVTAAVSLHPFPKFGQLSCKVQSFYEGESQLSPLVASQESASLAVIHP